MSSTICRRFRRPHETVRKTMRCTLRRGCAGHCRARRSSEWPSASSGPSSSATHQACGFHCLSAGLPSCIQPPDSEVWRGHSVSVLGLAGAEGHKAKAVWPSEDAKMDIYYLLIILLHVRHIFFYIFFTLLHYNFYIHFCQFFQFVGTIICILHSRNNLKSQAKQDSC